jgi:hypothetical protein
MDLNFITLDIVDYITHFDFYDSLASAEISKRSGSHEKLDKLRTKSQEHLKEFFAGASFRNRKNQLRPLAEQKEIITAKIAGMKEKDLEDFVGQLKKDAKKIKALYKEVSK